MIISKTPYRIPLAGGGTDLDFYYKKRSGSLFSLAINQYVYVYLHHRKVDNNYLIQTTKSEFASKNSAGGTATTSATEENKSRSSSGGTAA